MKTTILGVLAVLLVGCGESSPAGSGPDASGAAGAHAMAGSTGALAAAGSGAGSTGAAGTDASGAAGTTPATGAAGSTAAAGVTGDAGTTAETVGTAGVTGAAGTAAAAGGTTGAAGTESVPLCAAVGSACTGSASLTCCPGSFCYDYAAGGSHYCVAAAAVEDGGPCEDGRVCKGGFCWPSVNDSGTVTSLAGVCHSAAPPTLAECIGSKCSDAGNAMAGCGNYAHQTMCVIGLGTLQVRCGTDADCTAAGVAGACSDLSASDTRKACVPQ